MPFPRTGSKVRGMAPLAVGAMVVAGLVWQGLPADAAEEPFIIPPPATDEAMATDGLQTAVFAGGCFWGVQAVFQHTEGVVNAVSGYAGGELVDPSYRQVTTGTTGHAESVEITYDPSEISYGQLLHIFFSVVHDPTQLNRQGPDVGTHYRSAIFTVNDEQATVAEAYIGQLEETGIYDEPIVTEVSVLDTFYRAEDYHQDYATLHPNQPYIVYNDLPKIANLKEIFPGVWREKPKLVFAENESS